LLFERHAPTEGNRAAWRGAADRWTANQAARLMAELHALKRKE
jgi:hypothetical protein